MKSKHFFFGLAVIAAGLSACNNAALEPDDMGMEPNEIQFVTNNFTANVLTKAAAVDVLSLQAGFNVSCVKGSAGSDTEVWSSYLFEYDGTAGSWAGENTGKWWPLSDESYRFYAVFPSDYVMTYAAAGPTIQADNTHDIVAAYMGSPTYKAVNSLNFTHIFARLKNVTVSAADGYAISDIDIRITPKTGGTYNLYTGAGQTDGTGWSDLTTGAATSIAPSAPGTQANDIYLVPGTYSLTASWTATKGNYNETFEDKTVDVSLVAGKTSNITVNLIGNATELRLTVGMTDWEDEAVDAGTVPVVSRLYGSFGGYMIAPQNLSYDGTDFVIAGDDWDTALTLSSSLGVGTGKTNGSFNFSYEDICSYFDSRENFHSTGGGGTSVNNTSAISYGGYNDWCIPTRAFFQSLFTSDPAVRPGSTVNGTANVIYKRVNVSDYSATDNRQVYLCFPDGLTLTGASVANPTPTMTKAEINEYVFQGCAVFPMRYNTSSYSSAAQYGTGTKDNGTKFYMITMSSNVSNTVSESYSNREHWRLVRQL